MTFWNKDEVINGCTKLGIHLLLFLFQAKIKREKNEENVLLQAWNETTNYQYQIEAQRNLRRWILGHQQSIEDSRLYDW